MKSAILSKSQMMQCLKEYSVILIKSVDIKKTRLFPKFQLILIFRLQVMHDYVH